MGLFENDLEKAISAATKDIRSVKINPDRTVLINMNTINGYFFNGEMSSPRTAAVIPEIVNSNKYFHRSKKLFCVERHTAESTELIYSPPHCIDLDEYSIISQLGEYAESENSMVVYTNSNNAFFTRDFMSWFAHNRTVMSNYIIVGAHTDIAVIQFALSLRAHFNETDTDKKRVAVIENAVQTFDSLSHNGDRMQTYAFFNMLLNGVELLKL